MMRSEKDVLEARNKLSETVIRWEPKLTMTQKCLLNGMLVALNWAARSGGAPLTDLLEGKFDREMENGEKLAPARRAAEMLNQALNGRPWLLCAGHGTVDAKEDGEPCLYIHLKCRTNEADKWERSGWAGFPVKVIHVGDAVPATA